MEDKRIIKTRKNIKSTFIDMLQEEPFEKITVTDLCRRGVISRITFYTYYDSKYALLGELFTDYISEADKTYHELQIKNNPTGDGRLAYENLLESILTLFFSHMDFFKHTSPRENPYLFTELFNHVFSTAEDYMNRHQGLTSKYPIKQTAALICNGLIGVITISLEGRMRRAEVREIARAMFSDLLQSELFRS